MDAVACRFVRPPSQQRGRVGREEVVPGALEVDVVVARCVEANAAHLATEPAGDVPSGLIIRFADESDVQILRQVENIAEWLKGSMEEKIRSGDLCLVALSGDVVEGFNIAAFGTVYIPLIRRERRFRGSEAWSEHIAVQPDFRKRGLAAHLRYRMFEELASRGIKRFYGGTLSTNIPALKLAQKVGFKTLADIVYISVLGRKCWRFKRAIS